LGNWKAYPPYYKLIKVGCVSANARTSTSGKYQLILLPEINGDKA